MPQPTKSFAINYTEGKRLICEILRATAGYSDDRSLYFFGRGENNATLLGLIKMKLQEIGLEYDKDYKFSDVAPTDTHNIVILNESFYNKINVSAVHKIMHR